MPVIEVEVNEDGGIGKLPEALQKFLDKRIDEAHRKGAEKAEGKLQPYLTDPVEMERLRLRDKALAEVELKAAERDKEYEKARAMRDEAAAKEKAEAIAAERKNTARAVEKVKASVAKSIRAAALVHNARTESLDELERLLAVEIDLDDDLNEFVKDAKDPKSPRRTDKGEAVTIEGLVADYLKTHPHHVAVAPSRGGGARGGATLSGAPPATDDRSRALAAIEAEPTLANVARGLAAIRKTG